MKTVDSLVYCKDEFYWQCIRFDLQYIAFIYRNINLSKFSTDDFILKVQAGYRILREYGFETHFLTSELADRYQYKESIKNNIVIISYLTNNLIADMEPQQLQLKSKITVLYKDQPLVYGYVQPKLNKLTLVQTYKVRYME